MWLYKLTSKTTGKSYVGATQRPISHRMSSHKHAALTTKRTTPLCQAIREHGIDDFVVTVLCKANDRDHLLFMEARAIAVYNTLTPHGYNFYASGLSIRRPHRQESKDKMSARKQGYVPWHKGKYANPNTVRARRARRKAGEIIPRIAWNKGKITGPMPEEQRQRRAETMRRVRAAHPEFWSTSNTTPKDCEV